MKRMGGNMSRLTSDFILLNQYTPLALLKEVQVQSQTLGVCAGRSGFSRISTSPITCYLQFFLPGDASFKLRWGFVYSNHMLYQ